MKKHLDDSDRKGIQKNSCASGDLDQVSSVNVADRHFPDLRGAVNASDSPRAASHDWAPSQSLKHFDDSQRKACRRWGKHCMDQDCSINVADRLSPDLRGTEVCTPQVAEEMCKACLYFYIGDQNGSLEDSRASGSTSSDWSAQVLNVPDSCLQLNEPLTAYEWHPHKWDFFCKLCWAYVTPEHLASPKHQKRGQWPEWYLDELYHLRFQRPYSRVVQPVIERVNLAPSQSLTRL